MRKVSFSINAPTVKTLNYRRGNTKANSELAIPKGSTQSFHLTDNFLVPQKPIPLGNKVKLDFA